jgi:hypothetical protein
MGVEEFAQDRVTSERADDYDRAKAQCRSVGNRIEPDDRPSENATRYEHVQVNNLVERFAPESSVVQRCEIENVKRSDGGNHADHGMSDKVRGPTLQNAHDGTSFDNW